MESNGKLPRLIIPGKPAALVPEFAVEDLPLGRTVVLVPEFAVKDLPGQNTLMIVLYKCKLPSSNFLGCIMYDFILCLIKR